MFSAAERVPLERETPNKAHVRSTPPGSARKHQPSHRLHTSLDQRSLILNSAPHPKRAAWQGKEHPFQPRSCLQKAATPTLARRIIDAPHAFRDTPSYQDSPPPAQTELEAGPHCVDRSWRIL
ncbi:hypothetical protein N7449_006404 [Penicillium cf. viridicatum]|uniref:Uncharacterized protein n=1 Tax=Penicillium cf. viridicatum TaxID=2972119 RepID=A0A9W9MB37_9EURO|nr:hypothetical protein N7449_006404 [Penicillium cf. viridicatum]